MRQRLIGSGFALLGATGAHRLAPASLRGLGAILMFHHVRPKAPGPFVPNLSLEIEPAFLEALIIRLRQHRYDIVSMDEAMLRLAEPNKARPPFAVLTFDDGYRDFAQFALPVLERHQAPFTLFVTTGFADRTAHLWWIELEEAVRRARWIDVPFSAEAKRLPARSIAEKKAAFRVIYGILRDSYESELLAIMQVLREAHDVEARRLVEGLCMDWAEIIALARHPLASIGAHTSTHPRLSQVDKATMLAEINDSRDEIARRTGQPIRHLAYPVGGPDSAGPREFAAAAASGFASAVTTRPGLIYPEHRDHATALPRLSINGLWQDLRNFDVLLSGAAFWLWNRGRRVNAA